LSLYLNVCSGCDIAVNTDSPRSKARWKYLDLNNAAGEQRPKFTTILHGLYGKPLATRRLLHWLVSGLCMY